jgi:hypothetical protein
MTNGPPTYRRSIRQDKNIRKSMTFTRLVVGPCHGLTKGCSHLARTAGDNRTIEPCAKEPGDEQPIKEVPRLPSRYSRYIWRRKYQEAHIARAKILARIKLKEMFHGNCYNRVSLSVRHTEHGETRLRVYSVLMIIFFGQFVLFCKSNHNVW